MSRKLLVGCIAMAGFLASSAPARTGEVQDSEQVSKLLSEAKTMAFQLKEDALEMERYTWMNLTWQSHIDALTIMKEHVNALGRQATKLKDARKDASPWQKTAIDRMEPYLDELGGYISASIEHVNDRKFNGPEYNDYLEANADYASDLATLIANFVDYGEARKRLDRLAAKLELPAHR